MKYAAIILRNVNDGFQTVECQTAIDGLLSGGVLLDEVIYLPYDKPTQINATLTRLSLDCNGVFLVCDSPLTGLARAQIEQVAGRAFEGEHLLETERCLFALLPTGKRGEEVALREVVPCVDKRRGNRYLRMVVRAVYPPTEVVKRALALAEEAGQGKLSLHANERYGDVRIEVVYDQNTPKMIADEVLRILATTLNDYVYALDDTPVEKRLVEALTLHRLHLSTAESFTAGGVGGAIVSVAGASAVFFEGLNTYDNKSKTARLNVSHYSLMEKGAVSDEVAYEMAAGLLASGNCDVAIATTGIAGPASTDTQKPVGLCFIAVGTKEQVRVYRYQLSGDRERITKTAVNLALYLAYREIK